MEWWGKWGNSVGQHMRHNWQHQMAPNRSEIEYGVSVKSPTWDTYRIRQEERRVEVVLARGRGEDEIVPKISFSLAEGAGGVMYRSSRPQQARRGGVRVFDQGHQHEM